MQGATCDKVISYLDNEAQSLTNKRHLTVAISRAKSGGNFLTVDTEKTIKTTDKAREERTATQAHRDGVNRKLDNPTERDDLKPKTSDMDMKNTMASEDWTQNIPMPDDYDYGIPMDNVDISPEFTKHKDNDLEI